MRCGKIYSRKSRGFFQRIFCSAAFHCEHCGTNRYYYRAGFALFQWYAYCPECHNFELTRLRRKDKIDKMSLNPFRFLLWILRFPLYYCTFCRFQFGDWHPLHPELRARRAKRSGA